MAICCVQFNSVLKSLLSTFTCTQNAPTELQTRYQMKLGREQTIIILKGFFSRPS